MHCNNVQLATSTVEIYTVARINLFFLLAEVKKCDPLPAINHLFSLRDRHPRQNDKAKNKEWFVGVFDVRGVNDFLVGMV